MMMTEWDWLGRNAQELARSEGFEPPTLGSEDLTGSPQAATIRPFSFISYLTNRSKGAFFPAGTTASQPAHGQTMVKTGVLTPGGSGGRDDHFFCPRCCRDAPLADWWLIYRRLCSGREDLPAVRVLKHRLCEEIVYFPL